MKKFENTRKHDGNITSQSFKYEIPYVYYHPLKITTDSIIFVYVGGNGSTIALFDLMNYPLFDQHYLFAFERMAHGNNRNRAKRFYPSYIKELDIVLTQVKTLIPNHKIYLLGES
jgi:hypothetical protein